MLHVMFPVTSAAGVDSRVANKVDGGLLTQSTSTFGYSLVVK